MSTPFTELLNNAINELADNPKIALAEEQVKELLSGATGDTLSTLKEQAPSAIDTNTQKKFHLSNRHNLVSLEELKKIEPKIEQILNRKKITPFKKNGSLYGLTENIERLEKEVFYDVDNLLKKQVSKKFIKALTTQQVPFMSILDILMSSQVLNDIDKKILEELYNKNINIYKNLTVQENLRLNKEFVLFEDKELTNEAVFALKEHRLRLLQSLIDTSKEKTFIKRIFNTSNFSSTPNNTIRYTDGKDFRRKLEFRFNKENVIQKFVNQLSEATQDFFILRLAKNTNLLKDIRNLKSLQQIMTSNESKNKNLAILLEKILESGNINDIEAINEAFNILFEES